MRRLLTVIIVFSSLLSCLNAAEMVPFVIPADMHSDSAIAMKAEPLTQQDRLTAREHFVTQDGNRVRLWGVNLSFAANFPTHNDAERVAKRMAAFGVNAVRLHHMDTANWPRGIWEANGKDLHPEALDRLDYFINQLAEHGIYVNLNLHVGKKFSTILDIPESGREFDKVTDLFTPELIEARKKYAHTLLTRKNRYRDNMTYAEDYAIAIVEISNEDSMFMSDGNENNLSNWDAEHTLRHLPTFYADRLQKKYNAWLKRKYGTNENLQKAWQVELTTKESLKNAGVKLFADGESGQRRIDRMVFLAETEKAYYDEMKRFLTDELNCRAMITGTIVFSPMSLYTQSEMDFIDGHAYWQHPKFPNKQWDMSNWFVPQQPMSHSPHEAVLLRLAAQRMEGKPFTVTEYNHPAPLDSQAECVPMIASFAAAQDWDGIWLYSYSHDNDQWDRQHLSGFFDIDSNPAKWGFMPAGAVMFRDGTLRPFTEKTVSALATSEANLTEDLARLHRAIEQNRVGFFGPLYPAMISTAFSHVLYYSEKIPPQFTGSDSGAAARLTWNVLDNSGLYLIRNKRSRVMTGSTRWCQTVLEDVFVKVDQPEFAAIAITAMDGRALDDSQKILITACGRCENTGMEFSDDRRTVGRNWGRAPVLIEPVEGTIKLPISGESPITCKILNSDGTVKKQFQVKNGKIPLKAEHGTMWYLMER